MTCYCTLLYALTHFYPREGFHATPILGISMKTISGQLRDSSCKGTVADVYRSISDHLDAEELPTPKRVAEDLGISDVTVRRCVARLMALSFLKIEGRTAKDHILFSRPRLARFRSERQKACQSKNDQRFQGNDQLQSKNDQLQSVVANSSPPAPPPHSVSITPIIAERPKDGHRSVLDSSPSRGPDPTFVGDEETKKAFEEVLAKEKVRAPDFRQHLPSLGVDPLHRFSRQIDYLRAHHPKLHPIAVPYARWRRGESIFTSEFVNWEASHREALPSGADSERAARGKDERAVRAPRPETPKVGRLLEPDELPVKEPVHAVFTTPRPGPTNRLPNEPAPVAAREGPQEGPRSRLPDSEELRGREVGGRDRHPPRDVCGSGRGADPSRPKATPPKAPVKTDYPPELLFGTYHEVVAALALLPEEGRPTINDITSAKRELQRLGLFHPPLAAGVA